MKKMDFEISPHRTCRVCLCESSQLKPICAKTENETKTILESLHFVVNIKVCVQDRLPNQICNNCETDLYAAEAFKRRCLNSEIILSEKFQIDNKCEIIEELSRKPNIIKEESPLTSIKPVKTTSKSEKRLHTINDSDNFSDEDTEPLILRTKLKIESNPEPDVFYEEPVESSTFICKKETIYLKQTNVEGNPSVINKKRGLGASKNHKHIENVVTTKRKKDKIKISKIMPIKEPLTISENCILFNTNKNYKNENHSSTKDRILTRSDKNETIVIQSIEKNNLSSDDATVSEILELEPDLVQPKNVCQTCKREFKLASQLKNHIIKVHVRGNRKDLDYECEICKASFPLLWLLNKHMRSHSEDAFTHICPECGKKLRNKYYLEEHMMRHQGVKPFQCDQCENSFVTKMELIMHSRRHNGETPFSCEHCGRKFRAYSSLVRHRRTHTGERPYKCDMCPKSFAESGTRNDHRRIHTGEKPFVCKYCDQKFTKRHHLKTHLKQHGEPSHKKKGSHLLKTDT